MFGRKTERPVSNWSASRIFELRNYNKWQGVQIDSGSHCRRHIIYYNKIYILFIASPLIPIPLASTRNHLYRQNILRLDAVQWSICSPQCHRRIRRNAILWTIWIYIGLVMMMMMMMLSIVWRLIRSRRNTTNGLLFPRWIGDGQDCHCLREQMNRWMKTVWHSSILLAEIWDFLKCFFFLQIS